MNTQPRKYYEAGYEGGSSAPTPKMSVEEYWHTNKELIISNYVLSKEKFLAFASQLAASTNSDESTPTSAPIPTTQCYIPVAVESGESKLPFEIEMLWNEEMPYSEEGMGYMNESDKEKYIKEYDEREAKVVFSNTQVGYDSCSHGSFPVDIKFGGNDRKYKGEFEDETALFLQGEKTCVRIDDYTKMTLGDFICICNLVGIKLEYNPKWLKPSTTPVVQGYSEDFIEALQEVIRISDRKHPAWEKVRQFLSSLNKQY